MQERRDPCFSPKHCLTQTSSCVVVTSNDGEIDFADDHAKKTLSIDGTSRWHHSDDLRVAFHRDKVLPTLQSFFPNMTEEDGFPNGVGPYPLAIDKNSFIRENEVFHTFLVRESIIPWKIGIIEAGFPRNSSRPSGCIGPLKKGPDFFSDLVRRISLVHNVSARVSVVTASCPMGETHVNLIKMLSNCNEAGEFERYDSYPDTGKPCRVVLEDKRKAAHYVVFRTREILERLFPTDERIKRENLQFFMGVPILDRGKPVGHFIFTGTKPLTREKENELATVLYHFRAEVCNEFTHSVMQEVQDQLNSMINGAAQPIVTICEYGNVLSVNPAMEQILGFPPDELIGYNINKIMPQPEKGRHQGYLEKYAATGISKSIGVGREVVGQKKDGTLIPLHLTVTQSFTKGSRIYTGILTDMTKYQAEKDKLHQEKALALSAAEEKAGFLSHMSHEIRTPMNGIIGMIGLLLETEMTSDQKAYAKTVQNSGIDLVRIINDILDFSKIEAGKLELESIEFDPRLCLENIGELLAPAAHEKGLELAVLIFHNFPRTLKGDPGRLRQVLLNLLNNAIKFTERGEIGIRAELLSQSLTEARVRFSVTDTGPGIPVHKIPTLFDSFTQEDASTTRRFGGTGLGLTISQQLVELMGGHIQVESELGRGSGFSFDISLPLGTEKRQSCDYDETLLQSARIVLVAGHQTHLQVLQEDLVTLGCGHIATHSDIDDLENYFRRNEVDVLLFDNISSPFSLEVLTGLLKRLSLANSPKIIYLTPLGHPGEAKEKQSQGIAAYLSKPVTHGHLCKALLTVLDPNYEKTAPLVTSHSLNEFHHQDHRILVAEDHPTNQKLIVIYLQKWGYEVDLAANGKEALTAFKENDYDLVLMDCQMPEMDGFEATKQMRAEERHRDRPSVPILALTANSSRMDADKCRAAGMNAHIAKPLDPQKLRATLYEHLPPHEDAPVGLQRAQMLPLESLLMYPEELVKEKEAAMLSLEICERILKETESVPELEILSAHLRDLVDKFEQWDEARKEEQLENINNQWRQVLPLFKGQSETTRGANRVHHPDADQLYALNLYLEFAKSALTELEAFLLEWDEDIVPSKIMTSLGNTAHNLKSSLKAVGDSSFADLWGASQSIEMTCASPVENHAFVAGLLREKIKFIQSRFPAWRRAMEAQTMNSESATRELQDQCSDQTSHPQAPKNGPPNRC